MRAALAALALCLASLMPASAQLLDFESLPGWDKDDHLAALQSFQRTCDMMDDPDWQPICGVAASVDPNPEAARAFFELLFKPVLIGSPPALFTGYYEADLNGALEQGGMYQYPIYALPRDLVTVDVRDFAAGANLPNGVPSNIVGRVVDSGRGMRMTPYYTRAEIDGARAIASAADVLVWADDPVMVHVLHVQGSGRVTLPDGSVMRIGFAGSNGRQFKGIGSILLEAGALKPGGASMIAVREWLRAHPDEAAKYMNQNTRYIFFRKLNAAEAQDGPVGASGVSLTPGRSLAVDPRFIPLGAPVWLDTKDPDDIAIQRLVVAQDTGAAITGPVRGDFFWGHGEEALMKAARMKSSGTYVVFVPKAPESLSSPVPPPVEPSEDAGASSGAQPQ